MPVAPVGPVVPTPVGPETPAPVGPVAPAPPAEPGVPCVPDAPVGPVAPTPPAEPGVHCVPDAPVGPVVAAPGDPVRPVGPVGPVGPVAPADAASVVQLPKPLGAVCAKAVAPKLAVTALPLVDTLNPTAGAKAPAAIVTPPTPVAGSYVALLFQLPPFLRIQAFLAVRSIAKQATFPAANAPSDGPVV